MPSEPGLTRPTRVHPTTTAAYPPPNLAEPLPCPRCNSTITKFCYYNNYNLAQPRYFCKSCRRYWTHGGTLRDVPVGGGTRRSSSKRHRSFSTTTATTASSSTTSSSVVSTIQQTEETAKMMETKGSDVLSSFGSFASLLGGGQSEGAFLALGSGNGEVDYGSGFGFGYGFDEMGVGYSGGDGGDIPVGNGGGDTWQIGEMEGKNGDSLIWPGLEMSMQQSNNI